MPLCDHDYIVDEIVSLKPSLSGINNITMIKEHFLEEENKRGS